ncbi:MAG: Rrf2 family transcriptional regulator [Armatimonadota bacterium]|nr:Rrf2 family transcriptional regulator [Armatimonadota bacterium]MDR7402547.1 Rrf2 family transcriptional regulator [Armatimonadota bacterium]MDR7403854.1 Rrf2 family transcriptional regulator [Armatimonadota bacterium]MDR7436069.1 Rrf2 family transcriptional regulator [Armatimonadota bacterium]MDR7471948.1 Rrf2 family transcriptional regulator [Armatimonadota bacterium]
MRVSTRAEYGLRALIDLASHYGEGPVQTHDIAARQGLPEPYLNQLMAVLRRAGLVTSKRGPAGGHVLARPPEAISLREAFDVLEGAAAPWWCVETSDPDCVYAPGCGLRPVWQAINRAVERVLAEMTLADIARVRQPAGHL